MMFTRKNFGLLIPIVAFYLLGALLPLPSVAEPVYHKVDLYNDLTETSLNLEGLHANWGAYPAALNTDTASTLRVPYDQPSQPTVAEFWSFAKNHIKLLTNNAKTDSVTFAIKDGVPLKDAAAIYFLINTYNTYQNGYGPQGSAAGRTIGTIDLVLDDGTTVPASDLVVGDNVSDIWIGTAHDPTVFISSATTVWTDGSNKLGMLTVPLASIAANYPDRTLTHIRVTAEHVFQLLTPLGFYPPVSADGGIRLMGITVAATSAPPVAVIAVMTATGETKAAPDDWNAAGYRYGVGKTAPLTLTGADSRDQDTAGCDPTADAQHCIKEYRWEVRNRLGDVLAKTASSSPEFTLAPDVAPEPGRVVGPYTIDLTVVDDEGQEASSTHTVNLYCDTNVVRQAQGAKEWADWHYGNALYYVQGKTSAGGTLPQTGEASVWQIDLPGKILIPYTSLSELAESININISDVHSFAVQTAIDGKTYKYLFLDDVTAEGCHICGRPNSLLQLGTNGAAGDGNNLLKTDTMAGQGCATTSLSMALWAAGITTLPLPSLGPNTAGELNSFLSKKGGYDGDRGTIAIDTGEPHTGGWLLFPEGTTSATEGQWKFQESSYKWPGPNLIPPGVYIPGDNAAAEVEKALCAWGQPMVVQVPSSKYLIPPETACKKPLKHFVVIDKVDWGASAPRYFIKDPSGQNADTLDKYCNNYKTRGFLKRPGFSAAPKGAVAPAVSAAVMAGATGQVSIYSGDDVQLLLIDARGQRTGYAGKADGEVTEVPESAYALDVIGDQAAWEEGREESPEIRWRALTLNSAVATDYELRVISTAEPAAVESEYEVLVTAFSADNVEQPPVTLRGTIWAGGQVRYRMQYDPTSEEMPPVVTEVVPEKGDLDGDGDVDQNDLNILLADRNKSVSTSSCGTACDLDGDGMITALDARKLMLLCTRPRCATQ